MKDLVCVVADRQIAAALEELLLRRRALGIRPVEAEILVHPHHDPGCYARPADLLRGYRQAAEHALIVLDHAWEGVPAASGAALEALINERLDEAGMADWAVPVVIEPELEAWVFSASPHVAYVLGWKPSWSPIREALEERNLWAAADAKPADPKEAIKYILRRTGKSRSASLFRRLARKVNTAGCRDRAFLRLKNLLRGWFPPVSPSGGGRPNGPSPGRTHDVEYETRTRRSSSKSPCRSTTSTPPRPRAVIFAQMVDDPSAHPDLFPTEKAQERERRRLFGLVRDLVKRENTTNEVVLGPCSLSLCGRPSNVMASKFPDLRRDWLIMLGCLLPRMRPCGRSS